MKILQVSNFFKPSWETGGVTKINYELSKYLVERSHEVTVYTTDGYSSRLNVPKNEPVEVDGIKVYYFYNIFRYIVKNIKFPIPYYLPIILKKEIKTFDIIHIHEHRTLSAAIVYHYAKKNEIPYVLQAHGSVLPFFQKSKLKRFFDNIIGYKILTNAAKVIALTETEANQYLQMGIDESKIVIIPNGININEFKNLPSEGEFKEKYLINDEDKTILYLGRINKIKGIEFLIDSFCLLITEMENIKLIIVGPPSDYTQILKQKITNMGINEHVLFINSLYGRNKLEVYVDADVLVYPSEYEIFGLVPFEAIMCGVPVVVTDKCGCSKNIRDANCGYIVKYGDVNDFTNSIKFIINNPVEAKNMARNGKQYIENNLDFSTIVEKIENIYEDCIRNF